MGLKSTKMSKYSSVDKTCPICQEEIDFFCYGECEHATCVKCAIKLRKFNNPEEPEFSRCPTCREKIQKIVMMSSHINFSSIRLSNLRRDATYDFLFESTTVEKYYAKQLLCICPICDKELPSISALNRHSTNEHCLSYCDLCIKHARLLPCEFQPMTVEALARHRKWNNATKQGHPNCDFCDTRFYEFEDLLSHIRDAHFMCDICRSNNKFEVFRTQAELLSHYEARHYVCQQCKKENSISYFATEEQLGIHQWQNHNQSDWTPVSLQLSGRTTYNSHRRVIEAESNPPVPTVHLREAAPAEWTQADFPTLAPNAPGGQDSLDADTLADLRSTLLHDNSRPSHAAPPQRRSVAQVAGSRNRVPPKAEDFPSLGGPAAGQPPPVSSALPNWTATPAPSAASAASRSVRQRPPEAADFPTLANTSPDAGISTGNKKRGRRAAKPAKPVDFSEFSLVNVRDRPLPVSAQRIINAQKEARKAAAQPKRADSNPVTSSSSSANLDKLKLPQRMARRGMSAFVDTEREQVSTSSNIVRVDSLPGREPAHTNGHQATGKAVSKLARDDFPTLSLGDGDKRVAEPALDPSPKASVKSKKKKKPAEEDQSTSLSTIPDTETRVFAHLKYTRPATFTERNKKLMREVEQFFDGHGATKAAYTSFNELSRRYMSSDLRADDFVRATNGLVRAQAGETVDFSWVAELIALLPNVAKQQALLRSLKGRRMPNTGDKKVDSAIDRVSALGNGDPAWATGIVDDLLSCKTCKQVCRRADGKTHNSEANHS